MHCYLPRLLNPATAPTRCGPHGRLPPLTIRQISPLACHVKEKRIRKKDHCFQEQKYRKLLIWNKLFLFQKCLFYPIFLERMLLVYISFGNQLFIRRTKDCEILFGKEWRKPINKYTELSAVNTFLIYPASLPLEYISNPGTIYRVQGLSWGRKKKRKHHFFDLFFSSIKSWLHGLVSS